MVARTPAVVVAASLACALALGPSLAAADADDAVVVLAHAKAVMGFAQAGTSVLHYRAVVADERADQSEATPRR